MAGYIRGARIAAQLGVSCETAFTTCEPGEWVCVVKHPVAAGKAKQAGARVIFDPVDLYAYDNRPLIGGKAPDIVVAYSERAMGVYAGMFPNADFMLVPHNWDDRIEGEAPQDEFRAGYIGLPMNLHEAIPAEIVGDLEVMREALPRFNCHVAEHYGARSMLFKPATKVASAAAVGANIVTHRSAAAMELLGEDYPFFADGTLTEGLERARAAFGGPEWERGLQIMRRVKERTSLQAVADLYREFL